MAFSSSTGSSFLLLAVAVVGIILSGGCQHVYAETDCSGDFKDLSTTCAKYVTKTGPKVPPSPECCNVVRRSNLPCVCSHITKEMEKLISVEKVAYVAKSCKRSLPSGTKCGSLTIPILMKRMTP